MYARYEPSPHELEHRNADNPLRALAEIAKKHLRDQVNDYGCCGIVCGPMTTGGTGNETYNFEIFVATIHGLRKLGENIFNQLPYERRLHSLAEKWKAQGNSGYCFPILTDFYTPIFESKYIAQGWFLPTWASSKGADFEHSKFNELRISTSYLDPELIYDFLNAEYPSKHVEEIMRLLPR